MVSVRSFLVVLKWLDLAQIDVNGREVIDTLVITPMGHWFNPSRFHHIFQGLGG